MAKTIFITGTRSGLGRLTAIHFANMGWNVAATISYYKLADFY
jgi:NAD(P)-dependent dehydrogenase (short-subunit alcohol dehydrogenase family)